MNPPEHGATHRKLFIEHDRLPRMPEGEVAHVIVRVAQDPEEHQGAREIGVSGGVTRVDPDCLVEELERFLDG